RADGQQNLFVDQPGDQLRVLGGAYAVVDTADLEQIQRLPDVFGRAFLAGVGDGQQALGAGLVEHALELARRVADFRAVQADGEARIAIRLCMFQRPESRYLRQMAQEALDQSAADAHR